MDRDLAIEDLKIIKQVFEKHKTPFFLAYGTCLGVYRDNDFLPGDNDIDLGVVESIDHQTRKSIGWMLYDLGFKDQDIMFKVYDRMEPAESGYNGTEKTGIIVCEKSIKITIFFFYERECEIHGKEMSCIPKLGAPILISSPAKFYKKLDTINFYEGIYNIPSPVEEYLEWTYEDWKNPLKRDHGKLHFETHSEKEAIKNIRSAQRVVFKNSRPK